MTVIIIFKLHIWRIQFINEDWMTVIIIFKLRIWRTHSVSMRTEWPLLSLFSNNAFDVHTVYQWGLNDRYHYFHFQSTHLTYTQFINGDWMTAIIVFKLRIWRTHSVSIRNNSISVLIICVYIYISIALIYSQISRIITIMTILTAT